MFLSVSKVENEFSDYSLSSHSSFNLLSKIGDNFLDHSSWPRSFLEFQPIACIKRVLLRCIIYSNVSRRTLALICLCRATAAAKRLRRASVCDSYLNRRRTWESIVMRISGRGVIAGLFHGRSRTTRPGVAYSWLIQGTPTSPHLLCVVPSRQSG